MFKLLWLYIKKHTIRVISVMRGMSVTIRYLFKKPITEKYPYDKNRAGDLPARFRGQLALISERRAADNQEDCIACKMCEKVCPNRSIVIEMGKDKRPDGKTYPEVFDWNYSTCIFCNLCVEACNFDALTFITTFEGAQQSRETLLWDKHMLVDAYNNSKKFEHKRSHDEFWEKRKQAEAAKAAAKAASAPVNAEVDNKAATSQSNQSNPPAASGGAR